MLSTLASCSFVERETPKRSGVELSPPMKKRKKCEKEEAIAENYENYPTKWEEKAVANMGWMLREVRIFLLELQYLYTDMHGEQLKMVLSIVADKSSRCLQLLKSLLDYTTYFCYCHFSNKGKPDKTYLTKITFPYIMVKTSDNLTENVKTCIFGHKNDTTSTTNEIDRILQVFLRVQPIVSDEKGTRRENNYPNPDDTSKAYTLNVLLSLTAHINHLKNDFVGFAKKGAYWDVKTASLKYEQNESQSLLPVKEGFFIIVPNSSQLNKETEFVHKPLLQQMLQLTRFVAETAKEILEIACKSSKDLIDKEFNKDRVRGDKSQLTVDHKVISWEEYDKASSLLYT